MELSKEKMEIYEKNLQRLQDAADELMGRMKGHGYSFRREITDGKGKCCPEKLQSLVEEMLSLWEKKQYARFPKAIWAKSYLQVRRELYGQYLYLVMRCSLYRGGYYCVRDSELKERTDFAFVLEQAKWFSRNWCITDGPDGRRQNEPGNGYDGYFGFHLYSPVNHYLTFGEVDVRNLEDDWAMTPPHMRAENRLYRWTAGSEEEEEPAEAEQLQEADEPGEAEPLQEAKETEKAEPLQDMGNEDLFYEEEDDDDGFADAFYDPEEDEVLSPLDMLDEEDRTAWWIASPDEEVLRRHVHTHPPPSPYLLEERSPVRPDTD